MNSYDYIVVGAGSSGSVVASRLSENSNIKVCLIEAGGSDKSLRVQIPAGTITLYKSKRYSWNFVSMPQKRLNNRTIHTPRGKALGGSASMNSMIYIRGDKSDYDEWSELGCHGWGWEDVLYYFKKSENNLLGQDPEYHGKGGELLVDKARDPNLLSKVFVKAANNTGLPLNDDFNGKSLEGCGIYNLTQKNARRLSSYRAYIHPVIDSRPNLSLFTEGEVESLIVENDCVLGVRMRQNGTIKELYANKEVILSAGSFGSPAILLKSGIGPADELKKAGVKPRIDLPGVGKNLQEHLDGLITVRSPSAETLGFSFSSIGKVLTSPFKYLFRKEGWLTTNYVEAGGFAKTKPGLDLPDVQFHFVPGYRSHRGRLFEWGHGYAIH
ncbi:GMC family oxidoreductase, partial [Halomonas sp.]|uniref:GMC family oxidoreductase n=1 Tax=Halomonas sp. TaxID=1486246 RepID=UPI003F94815A